MQNCTKLFNMLYNRQEIPPENKNGKKPNFTQVWGAHKITKNTITGTANTVCYIIIKCLTNLLYCLTKNMSTVSNSFETANQVEAIPSELFLDSLLLISHLYLLKFFWIEPSR